jgi:signal transduction histidine kinase/DNA-binding response OmpR family regulator
MKVSSNTKPKILVVDDEPDNLDLLYRTFHREFQVLRAESGPTALGILENEGDIAVIISDQRMPMMSGTEFLSLTATQYPDIIRIILTGFTDVEDLVEAINAGKVFKYVTKPWDDEELKGVVRQAVDTHNVLKARTRELRRSLRQESLLNTVTSTIRSALSYDQILQTIGESIGQMLEVSACVVCPFRHGQMSESCFIYLKPNDSQPHPPQLETDLRKTLICTVWETHEVQAILDAKTDARIQGDAGAEPCRQAYAQADIASTLMIPLICQQELIAVLALHQRHLPRLWLEEEIQLLEMVADQGALALSQARAYEQVRALAKREALINTITTAIRSSLDPGDIFAAITQQLGQALQVDGCALSLWTVEDQYGRCVGLYDSSQADPSIAITLDEQVWSSVEAIAPSASSEDLHFLPQSRVPIAGNPVLTQLMETQQPVVLDDMQQYPELDSPDQFLRFKSKALLVVPLISDGKIIGSISLRQNQAPRFWQPAEVELAQSVAAQAAIAVQQSRLYQTTRQQAEQLLALDRQKNEFFQNISHEFRTPLTLTLGPLESAVAQQQGLSYDQSVMALRNSRRLLRLVNQLLDLQRLDAGRMQAIFRPCNLTDFVSHTVDAFRTYSEKKGIQLYVDLQPCPLVYLDPERFDKVLYNLLSNAMKFTPDDGRITVTVAAASDRCILTVRDTGIGIRADQLPVLFERFRQAEGSANRTHEGTGLGLALVKELVALHGGSVAVESIYGAGTTFTVSLPMGTDHLVDQQIVHDQATVQVDRAVVELADLEIELQGDRDETENPTDKPIDGLIPLGPQVARVLIVDDNPDLRTYLSSILRARGYQVWTARNGAEGFEAAVQHHPQLIITDLMMPKVSGLDLIRMIRQDADLQGTPIVLLTAKADEDTRIDGVEQGADGYLSKPFSDRELLAEVHNLLALKANEQRVAELNTYLTESVLKRFLPNSLVQRAAKGELVLHLRPEPRLLTVLFTDIIGFTQLSNTLRSRRVAELLNEYLAEMTQVIFNNGGTIDKFMGDAILALFGAPEELNPNEQVRRAVETARQMRRALNALNQRWQEQGIGPVQFRCGIHQGTAVVGMFGGPERSDYTAIGPSVNIASRIQYAAEPDSILVSAAVADYLAEDEITKFSPLQLKGVDETVLTFTVKPEL